MVTEAVGPKSAKQKIKNALGKGAFAIAFVIGIVLAAVAGILYGLVWRPIRAGWPVVVFGILLMAFIRCVGGTQHDNPTDNANRAKGMSAQYGADF